VLNVKDILERNPEVVKEAEHRMRIQTTLVVERQDVGGAVVAMDTTEAQ
jgi:hypothetical protein